MREYHHLTDSERRSTDIAACDELLRLLRLHHSAETPEATPEPALADKASADFPTISGSFTGRWRTAPTYGVKLRLKATPRRMKEIIATVSRQTGVSAEDILSRKQHRHIVGARHLVMWIAHDEANYSMPEIGRALNRDHTTVLSGIQKMRRLYEQRS